jgi:uncharacterized repeat protein (TIGR03803 family)
MKSEIHQMNNQRLFPRAFSVLILTLVIFVVVADAGAKENVILHFDGTHGAYPTNALVADANGNLYGTTLSGGSGNSCRCGVVFELSAGLGGAWTESVLHVFKGGIGDGSYPWSALVFDGKGNLFGETLGGGTSNQGTIFELTPGTNNTWTEAVIFSLPSQDGPEPGNHLTLDSNGNIYGVLSSYNQNGGVFELSRQANGSWTQTILYAFKGGSNGDGETPFGGVVFDSKGNLYGTTSQGGSLGYGTVFELASNPARPAWTESVLYNFTNQGDGGEPRALLTIDATGNLYGTTFGGGANREGTVFELSQSNGKWNQSVLYSFGNNPADGSFPAEVIFDAKGNLYGTTQSGGNGCNSPGCGNVFALTPQKNGPWREIVLHQFESAGDGSRSSAGLVVEKTAGRLYGTTEYGGGRYGLGTVFLIER